MPQDISHHLTHQLTRRVATILGLAGIAVIHLLDLPGKFAETPYLAWAYLGMILACAILIERIATNPKNADYLAAAGVAASVLAGFVVNRTVGMPGATEDIGNWLEPLGFLSLFVEAFTVWQALAAYRTLKAIGEAKRSGGPKFGQPQDRQYSVSLG
jgi:hypothetical protein